MCLDKTFFGVIFYSFMRFINFYQMLWVFQTYWRISIVLYEFSMTLLKRKKCNKIGTIFESYQEKCLEKYNY